MASLFSPEEALYDRYAAAIAATEPLRAARDKELCKAIPLLAVRERARRLHFSLFYLGLVPSLHYPLCAV